MKPKNASETGRRLIKHYEGFKANAYLCPAGVWTIGFGHTRSAKVGMCITLEGAEALLTKDLKWAERSVKKLVRVPLSQFQFDALVSFVFNLGVNAFRMSTMLKMINENKASMEKIGEQFGRWVRCDGEILNGLVKRRKDELTLWMGEVPGCAN